MSEETAQKIKSLLNKDNIEQTKVLLVEDSQFDMILIKGILEQYFPFTLIEHAPTRVDGLRLVKCDLYDVILLDLHLPDSLDLSDINDFKKNAPQTPLFIVTGSYNDEAQNAAKQYGADGIVGKEHLSKTSFDKLIKDAVDNIANI